MRSGDKFDILKVTTEKWLHSVSYDFFEPPTQGFFFNVGRWNYVNDVCSLLLEWLPVLDEGLFQNAEIY